MNIAVGTRELDPDFGFAPQPLFPRRPSWPRASAAPATPPVAG
jgi:hypothetical protein